MALIKKMEMYQGITFDYHRISRIDNITNKESIIEVKNYIDKNQRQIEKSSNINDVFVYSIYLKKEYTEDLTIDKAYEYIKTLPEFEGAIDD